MPFIRETEGRWRPCATVDLRQLPERRRTQVLFEVLDEFGHTRLPPDGRDPAGRTWSRAAVQHVVPAGFVTDLASVPAPLWGVIASYGRQTLPAVLHDLHYAAARAAPTAPHARRVRREADELFCATLRETGAGPVRQWLMWAGVRSFGSPAVVVPLVVLGVVLLALGVLKLAGQLTVPSLALAAGGVALGGLLASLVVTSVEEHGGAVRLRLRSLGGLLAACALVLVAAPPVVVVIVVTTLVRLVVELGERPAAASGSAEQETAPTARIAWSPLVARVPPPAG
ncbi:DUF1353 domain-containing protein [Georgenia phoenicis]|uniref:DUF1353 domain-containing protein n=1 Tax=unclassified Georgenia TaxID=2626815 RepID=UPI0039B1291E